MTLLQDEQSNGRTNGRMSHTKGITRVGHRTAQTKISGDVDEVIAWSINPNSQNS